MTYANEILVLEDEALLRSMICEVLEAALPGTRTRPAGTRDEASNVLESGSIDQLVSEVRLAGSNVSLWLGAVLVQRPALSLVTFSTARPWFPADLLESPRIAHVNKASGGLKELASVCRGLLT